MTNLDSATFDGAHFDPAAFDPFDPALRPDPYPAFHRLRERAPVLARSDGFWLLSRHRECSEVLSSPNWGHSETGRGFRANRPAGDPVRTFLLMNPPDHTRLRTLVSRAFTARVVAELDARVERVIAELLDAAIERDVVDLVEDFAYPLPVIVICELLGVPPADHALFHTWSKGLARGLDPDFSLPPDALASRARAREQFGAYFADLAAERRRAPRDDLLSRLAAITDGGDRLSEPELLATCTLLLVAGHETTVNLIANSVLALLRAPGQLARLRADPGLDAAAVEEFLRFDPPVQLTARVALRDTTLAGRPVPAGTGALLLLAAAGRDPALADDPEHLDVTRAPVAHLAFGRGIHFCLGAPLARLEARRAVRALIDRAPGLALANPDEQVAYRENLILRGLKRLPVRLR